MSIYVELTQFDKQRERNLRDRLDSLHHSGDALSYYQLHGLLFAMACSPEPIKPSEWFDLIWLNDEPQFENDLDARAFYRSVVDLSNHIGEMARQRRFLPFAARYDERWLGELSHWCEGLLIGHQYLEDLWMISLDDLDDQSFVDEIDAALNLATTFADRDEDLQLSFDQGLEATRDHLPEAYDLLWKVLATYATVGSLWAENVWHWDAEQLFLALEPVPRESLCPCGSGLIFAKCCLH